MSKKNPFAATLCFAGSFLSAETHRISPDRYYTTFSAAHPPIAHIRPGDTVVTKCLDSRGRNETGKLILDDDNVLTGPFYVDGAEAGDTLVVQLDRVRLNRDWGWNGIRITTDALAPEMIEGLFPANCCDAWLQPGRRNALRWNLDRTRGTLRLRVLSASGSSLNSRHIRHSDVLVWLLRTNRRLIPARWARTEATWTTTQWTKAQLCTCPYTSPALTSCWETVTQASVTANCLGRGRRPPRMSSSP